jgi:hypothetical protein
VNQAGEQDGCESLGARPGSVFSDDQEQIEGPYRSSSGTLPKGGKENKDTDDLCTVEQSNLCFPSNISFSDRESLL